MQINIAEDYTRRPGLRYETQTPGTSGEKFRIDILLPKFKEALARGVKLIVYMDGTNGYSSSFLEESFGGLAREMGPDLVLSKIEIIALEESYLKGDIEDYILKVKHKHNVSANL
jgi:hypothetical protein